jgi:hypothetical protein
MVTESISEAIESLLLIGVISAALIVYAMFLARKEDASGKP